MINVENNSKNRSNSSVSVNNNTIYKKPTITGETSFKKNGNNMVSNNIYQRKIVKVNKYDEEEKDKKKNGNVKNKIEDNVLSVIKEEQSFLQSDGCDSIVSGKSYNKNMLNTDKNISNSNIRSNDKRYQKEYYTERRGTNNMKVSLQGKEKNTSCNCNCYLF